MPCFHQNDLSKSCVLSGATVGLGALQDFVSLVSGMCD